ncbi:MAG: hypothetical protein AAF216_04080 [Pseudomonadota bacterium]
MPRPAGVRNRDFAEKRLALLDTLCDFALNCDLRRPSLRQFALAASASEPTLRHYFKDRQGVVMAILERIGVRGEPLWQTIATPASDTAKALEEYFRVSEAGMRHGGFIRAHAFGIIEGVADPAAAKAYLEHILEPALAAVEAKLSGSMLKGGDRKFLRAAALASLAPMLVMCLHQDLLGGDDAWPFDVPATMAHLQTMLSQGVSNISPAIESARI